MSDGPHRSLPMRRPWKTVAECADNAAFEVGEIREFILPALENDCRREMRREFLDDLRKVCADQEASLFKTRHAPRSGRAATHGKSWAWNASSSIMQFTWPRTGRADAASPKKRSAKP